MSMKSSHNNVIRIGQNGHFSAAWQPEEICQPKTELMAMDLATLTDLFAPAAGRDPQATRMVNQVAWQSMDELVAQIAAERAAELAAEQAAQQEAECAEEELRQAAGRPTIQMPAAPTPPSFVQLAEQQAEEILQMARQQAEQIKVQAQKTVDEMFTDAQADIERERQNARQKAIEEVHAEAESSLTSLQAVVDAAAHWKSELLTESEPIVIGMIQDMAQKMFGEGVFLSDEALQQNLNRVLENARMLGDLHIYLNPEDAATLNPIWREIRASMTGDRVQIIPSESITRGGCFVNGKMGSIDARIETQLQSTLNALNQVAQEGNPNA